MQSLEYVQSLWFSLKNILMVGYIARVEKEEFILSSEVDDAMWIRVEDALDKIYPKHPDNIAYILCKSFLNNKNIGLHSI